MGASSNQARNTQVRKAVTQEGTGKLCVDPHVKRSDGGRVEAKRVTPGSFPFDNVRKGVWAGYHRPPTYRKQVCWAKQTLEASKG